MMEFYYENHLGEIIPFYNSPYILTNHAFADWTLAYTTTNNHSSGFKIKPVSMAFTVRIAPRAVDQEGLEARYGHCIDEFVAIISKDTEMNGKLWTTTGQYLNCKIVASKKTAWNKYRVVTLSCTLLSDYPYWIKEQKHSISVNDNTLYPYLDYMYDYDVDYRGAMIHATDIIVDSTEESGFKLVIYGPNESPRIYVDGVWRGVLFGLGDSEQVIIDTIQKTVTKVSEGIEYNAFPQRIKTEASIFQKLPPGNVGLKWIDSANFELTVYEERKEPQWS